VSVIAPQGSITAGGSGINSSGGEDGGGTIDLEAGEIAVPLRIRAGDGELAFISTATTFGTAVDVTVSELSIESFFPAGDVTARALQAHKLSD